MRIRGRWVRGGCAVLAVLGMATSVHATTIVDDSWVDGGRTNGADSLDTAWFTSSTTTGIEVSTGSLGLVTGSSGRGIHTVFPTQTLSVGDKLVVTYTFATPATIGAGGGATFKVGVFDTLGRAGLSADISSSSASPSALYGWGTGATPAGPGTAGLPGYMLDMDVNTGTEDLSFRAHDPGTVIPTGRLLATNTGFAQLSPTGPDGAYTFAANTSYTGSITITRTDTTTMQLTGALGAATHTITDAFDSASFGMLAFWVNSATFGSSSTPGTADNGIDFSNVKIEFVPVPEPSSMALVAIGVGLAARRRR